MTKKQSYEQIVREFMAHKWDGKRSHLENIQKLVDQAGQPFEFLIQRADGVPGRLKFVPRKAAGVIQSP